MPRVTVLCTLLLYALSTAPTFGNTPGGGDTGPDVVLTDHGNTVGLSDWSTDWNYAQVSSIVPGTNWRWRINFNLESINDGNATLTLAFAGSDHARMYIYVNDESQPVTNFYPNNGGGNALIREGSHAKYSVSYVAFPTSRLNLGANTITLVQGSTGHVMYDYINLEMP